MREFFDRWYPRLVRYLDARLADPDEAEDLAQEAFVRLLERRPRQPAAWLFTVAGNLARDQKRLARLRGRHLEVVRAEHEAEREGGPERNLLRKEEAAGVTRALANLSERDRTLLLLHNAGFRYREIAAQLALAPTSIGPLLTRAQRRFLASYEALPGARNAQLSR